MRRGILAGLALCATSFVQPAEAAQTTRTGPVYEVVRTTAAVTKAEVKVHYESTGGPVDVDLLMLVPYGDGYRWDRGFGLRTSGGSGWLQTEVDLSGGRRALVAGVGARLRVEVKARGWSAPRTSAAYRIVTATPETATAVAGVPAEESIRATAVGGRYGSFAMAELDCTGGAGTWSFGTESGPARSSGTCVSGEESESGQVNGGARWSLEGRMSGVPLRRSVTLRVLDFPKPPR